MYLGGRICFTRIDGAKGSAFSQAGLHIAALPDVVFSVQSNQNQSTTGSNGYSLLKLINDRKREAGSNYPKLTTLREGKKMRRRRSATRRSLSADQPG